MYRVIMNDCSIAVGVGDVVECATSLITSVGLVSPIGGDTGGIGNLFNVARLAANPKFVWFSTSTAMRQSFIITLYYLSLQNVL
jgi:hypothetical protein